MPGNSSSYFAWLTGTANGTINVDDWAIVITPTANVSLTIKKIRFGLSSGGTTTIRDVYFRIKIQSLTGTPATGVALTPILLDGSSPASTSTIDKKNSANNFTGGSVVKTFDIISLWDNLFWEWAARDADDKIVLAPGEKFGVQVSCSTASFPFVLTVVWSEG